MRLLWSFLAGDARLLQRCIGPLGLGASWWSWFRWLTHTGGDIPVLRASRCSVEGCFFWRSDRLSLTDCIPPSPCLSRRRD